MSEEKKEEGCCSTTKSSCSCTDVKKIIIGIVLAALIFTLGYMMGKDGCPFGSGKKMCPIVKN